MSVWYAIPSKRPHEEAEPVLKLWRERGYNLALWRDAGGFVSKSPDAQLTGAYTGYATAVNALVIMLLHCDPDAEWIVIGGDDVLPDPNHSAEEIARQCSDLFRAKFYPDEPDDGPYSTFGVMQPTGDRWGDKDGAYIDRVAGSAWLGREFCKRMYGGRGPLHEGYFHMGCDEELQAVAEKLGVFWQRPDLTHFHQHWGRPKEGERLAPRDRMPKFLEKANSKPEWDAYKKLFAERKAAGFPGHEPL